MHTTSMFGLLGALTVLASAVPFEFDPSKVRVLHPRDDAPSGNTLWQNSSSKANTKIGFSDQKMDFGDTNPVDIINNKVAVACQQEGTCINAEDADAGKADLVNSDSTSVTTQELSYTATGNYATPLHNGLIQALAKAMQSQTKKTTKKVAMNTVAGPTPTDPDVESFDQYTGPQGIAVVYEDGGDTPPYITVSFKAQVADEGLCGTITAAGGAISGAIGLGEISSAFSLASVFCQAAGVS